MSTENRTDTFTMAFPAGDVSARVTIEYATQEALNAAIAWATEVVSGMADTTRKRMAKAGVVLSLTQCFFNGKPETSMTAWCRHDDVGPSLCCLGDTGQEKPRVVRHEILMVAQTVDAFAPLLVKEERYLPCRNTLQM